MGIGSTVCTVTYPELLICCYCNYW